MVMYLPEGVMQNAPLAHKWCVTSWHGKVTPAMRQRARQRPHCWGKWGRSLLSESYGLCMALYSCNEGAGAGRWQGCICTAAGWQELWYLLPSLQLNVSSFPNPSYHRVMIVTHHLGRETNQTVWRVRKRVVSPRSREHPLRESVSAGLKQSLILKSDACRI